MTTERKIDVSRDEEESLFEESSRTNIAAFMRGKY
jgi:hypothetical protein